PEVIFDRGDVNDVPKLWSLMRDVEVVIHLAARVSVRESTQYPRDYNHVNVGGTVSVLEAIRDRNVPRLVFSSSGALYGSQTKQPITEDTHPDPESPYAVSKLAAEYYIRATGRLWGIETISLRIFNVYGPGQQLPLSNPPVIPQFFKQISGGGSVVINGDGTQTRDFIYIDDVVAALARAATMEHYPGHVVINVGSGVETSIIDAAEAVGRIIKSTPQFLMNAEITPGVVRMCADISRMKTLLGIVPQTDLMTGLQNIREEDPRFAAG
ncbi:MAG TPA: NAD-dependent epimerase/dehydratase family protein, partial [Aggregatilineales bacterium]|nr:NAD-dependent epimerase/dehydratase family protein [Aggregatilineales bacterium]